MYESMSNPRQHSYVLSANKKRNAVKNFTFLNKMSCFVGEHYQKIIFAELHSKTSK